MDLRPDDRTSVIRTARSRDFYLAYLNSSAWRAIRNRALQRSHYHCERCDSKRDLQVHHKSYERLGAEWDADLEVLCANCHEGAHVDQMAQSSDAIYLKLAREAVRRDLTGSISNLAEDVKTLCARHKIPYDSGRITRAVELVTGAAVQRLQAPRHDGTVPDPQQITRQEAHEILCRLGVFEIVGYFIKDMPLAETPVADQLAHEARIREQIQAFRSEPVVRRRRPIRERLEEIFSSGDR